MESNYGDPESAKGLLHLPNGTPSCAGTDVAPIEGVRYIQKDIFKIAYDKRSLSFLSSLLEFRSYLVQSRDLSAHVYRYMGLMWRLSKWHTLELYMWMVGKMLLPSLSLYFGSLVIFNVDALLSGQNTQAEIMKDLQFQIVAWMLCGVLAYRVEVSLVHLRGELGSLLRLDLLPKLGKAALNNWDISNIGESYDKGLPYGHDFGSCIPGWDNFVNISCRLTSIFVIVFEMFTMLAIVSCCEERFDTRMMSSLIAAFLIAAFLLPTNGAGGAGWCFYPENPRYGQSLAAFKTIFDHQTRLSVLRDGLSEFLGAEFERIFTELGPVKTDTYLLEWHVLPAWYWGLTRFLMLHYPMAVCALLGFLSSSRSTVMTMIIFQYSVFTMDESIRTLEAEGTDGSIVQNMREIGKIFEEVDKETSTQTGFDFLVDTKSGGMKIDLQNVSHKYDLGSDKPAQIVDINLSIQPGQLVVIAGRNESGKTTLAKLIAGLLQPSSGNVIVNDTNMQRFKRQQFRQALSFTGNINTEVIYPVSLRQNLLYGLTSKEKMDRIQPSDLNTAAMQGGALPFIENSSHKWETVLNPPSITAYSLKHGPGKKAVSALRRFGPNTFQTHISPREKQRIVLSRVFLRSSHGDIRLIILDEAATELDAIAERQIYENFREITRRTGQTMIVITKRLHLIAEHADLVLCMENGSIEAQGTHEQLMADQGSLYAQLYNEAVQAEEGQSEKSEAPEQVEQ